MTTLFYLIAYAAIFGFFALAFFKIRSYLNASPLHVRWELYEVPHEGKKAAHGGSYMEESEWWSKPRHADHTAAVKALLTEVLFLHATFEHNLKLWFRTYPFHLGLYMLMGGAFLVLFTALAQIVGISSANGFIVFLGNVINVVSILGMLGIIGGGVGLIHRRVTDSGLNKYTTPEHYFNLGVFVLFALTGLGVWAANPSFFELSRTFMVNLLTFNFAPLDSSGFGLHMLLGFGLMVWIPLTHMGHLFMKYFMYHDIRWGDTPTMDSPEMQKKIGEVLNYPVSWSAPHVTGQGQKTWVEVATTNPAAPKE